MLTAILFPIPFVLMLAPLVCPDPEALHWLWPGGSMGLIWLWVWTYFRPSRFEVSPEGLRIVWPVGSRQILAQEMVRADLVSPREFRREFGWAARLGAGGLWVAFGFLWTARGLVNMYVSRGDGLVLVRHRSRRPLLITPQDPERFLETLATVAQLGE